ncbi:hypothetical protein I4U23_021947 [Adineta vaga]|nr:hypothetical protein I4U23_021947 [Adineta vaga]
MVQFPTSICDELNSILHHRTSLLTEFTDNAEKQKKISWMFDMMHTVLTMIKIKHIDCTMEISDRFSKQFSTYDTFASTNSWQAAVKNKSDFQSSVIDQIFDLNNHYWPTNKSSFYFILITMFLILISITVIVVIVVQKRKEQNKSAFTSNCAIVSNEDLEMNDIDSNYYTTVRDAKVSNDILNDDIQI